MPSLQEIEAYLRQNAGVPIEQGTRQITNAADTSIDAARHAQERDARMQALQQIAKTPPPQAQPPIPEVLPNAPTMTPEDAQSRMAAMIQAPLRGGTPMTFDAMQAQNAANMPPQAAAPEEKTEGYRDFGSHPALRQFPKIQQKVQTQKPVTKEDIRSMTAPSKELTPEQEEKINKRYQDEE